MNNLFVGQNFISVDFVFTGYYSLRFFTGRNEYKWINKVSPKVSRIENQKRLDFLLSLILNTENAPVVFQSVWRKFVEKQTNYFYKLHPTSYIGDKTLKGWETRKLTAGFFILCPRKLTFSIWRKYDGKEAVYGRLIDKVVDELGTTFVVVPDNDLLLYSDYINPTEGHASCPFLRGELVSYDTHNKAWFLAGVQLPTMEEFLED